MDHNTTDHNYIKYLAQNLPELGPYPTYSKYVNPLHFYQNTVMNQWSSKKAHPVLLQQLANFGKKLTAEKILASANFVRLEIAIRIAKKLRDFQVLPFAAISNHHLVRVYESYYNIFETFRKLRPINTLEENDEFCELISKMLMDNLLSLPHLTMGALECCILNLMEQDQLDEFMLATLRSRISRRLICEEHLSLTAKFKDANHNIDTEDYIGDIFYRCSAKENLEFCKERIISTLAEKFKKPILFPELQIVGEDVKFQFMLTHLRYLFGEILRNSFEYTILEFFRVNSDKDDRFFEENRPPSVVVTIIDNPQFVGFRFSDQGGGVKGLDMKTIWLFGKNEVAARESLRDLHKLPGIRLATDYAPINFEEPKPISKVSTESIDETILQTSLGGDVAEDELNKREVPNLLQNFIERPSSFKLNLGLAMCKVYAEYWNGNIVMNLMDNYGTDTFLTLQKLGIHTTQKLDKA